MKHYGLIAISCALCLLASCNRNRNYPGYTRVGSDGAGRTYYINFDTVQRHSDAVEVSLLTEEPGKTYTIINLATNCTGTLKELGGTQYRSDGTMLRNVVEDSEAVRLERVPELKSALIDVCKRAGRYESVTSEAPIPFWSPPVPSPISGS